MHGMTIHQAPGHETVNDQEKLRKQQLFMLFEHVSTSIIVYLVTSVALTYLLWPHIEPASAIIWLILIIIAVFVRGLVPLLYKLRAQQFSIVQWHWLYGAATLAGAVVWGSGAYLLFPQNSTEFQLVLLLFIAGMAAGSTTTLAAVQSLLILFILITMMPISLRFALMDSDISVVMGFISMFFMLILLINARRIHDSLLQNIQLMIRTEEQAGQINQEHQKAQQYLNIAGVIIVALDQQGNVTLLNQRGCELLEFELDDILQQNWFDKVIPAENQNKLKRLFRQFITGQIILPDYFENEIVTKTGKQRLIAWHNRVIKDKTGLILGTLSSGEDITEQIKAKQALIAALNQAENSARAKGDFLATMSHEIRTPMNGVLGVADLLAKTNLDKEQRDYVNTIASSGETLLTIINDILDISKIEAGELQLDPVTFNLQTLVSEVIALFQQSAEQKGLELILDWQSSLPEHLYFDKNRLRQILFNLIGNAIKFTHQGHVAIRVRHEEVDARMTQVKIVIEDTGIGIEPSIQKKLFTPFTQADASTTRLYGGTGLGLSISKRIIEMMQGTISLSSEPGKGSTFSLFIPIPLGIHTQEKVIPQAQPVVHKPESDKSSQYHVLLVEDNLTNQKIAQAMLKRLNNVVKVAGNGLKALQYCQIEQYDLILMDCQMPEMDGFEATEKLRKLNAHYANVPIVALTANAMEGDREKCLSVGMNDFIAKPIKIDQLRDVMDKWLM
jgi:PAS domain S-box-containing protein